MKIDETKFRIALKGICSFPRAFTTKRAFQASKQFGEAKIWMILKALHCLEEAGFYTSQTVRRAGESGGVDKAWICTRPEFLEGKMYGPPVEHGLELLRKWQIPTANDKLAIAIAALPAERRAASTARLVALITTSKHCLALRVLPYRARLSAETVEGYLDQWIYRGLVYMDHDSKGRVVRRTETWTADAAFKALDQPAALQPAVLVLPPKASVALIKQEIEFAAARVHGLETKVEIEEAQERVRVLEAQVDEQTLATLLGREAALLARLKR